MRPALVLALCLTALASPFAQGRPSPTLDIYQVDVEGGEATLFVSPSGESMLVDTGWPGFEGRDADRIAAAAKQAGVRQIDYLVVTHFHADHMGGAVELARRLPIRRFVDHGATVDRGARELAAFAAYADLRRGGVHIEAKPGDEIPIAGLTVRVIAAGRAVLTDPLPGGGAPNPLCAGFRHQEGEVLKRYGNAEDDQSVSLAVGYGSFRTLIMGDLNWNREYELVCPANKLGTVDLYLVSHHGSETSGSEAFVHAIRPRAAVMNNGARKGGAVQTFQILRRSPGLEDLWQNHYSIAGGAEHNAPETFIANLEDPTLVSTAARGSQTPPVHLGPAHVIKVSAHDDGRFTVTNGRNGYAKTYAPRRPAPVSQQSAAPVTLDFEFFRTRVQPIFVARRPGHARCVACHITGTTMRLQPLAPGSSTWSEEDSRKNFEVVVQRAVVPGSVQSRLLVHALAEAAGGDFYHTGGKHWKTQDDPEWQTLKAWVLGATARSAR